MNIIFCVSPLQAPGYKGTVVLRGSGKIPLVNAPILLLLLVRKAPSDDGAVILRRVILVI